MNFKTNCLFLMLLIAANVQGQHSIKSTRFGDDITIQNTPERNQRFVSFCTAFTGLQYSSYTYRTPNTSFSLSVLKSENNGEDWTPFFDPGPDPIDLITLEYDLLTNGSNLEELKLFRLFVFQGFGAGMSLTRYNGVTGEEETYLTISETGVRSAAIAGDNLFPALDAAPFSIALAISFRTFIDSLIIRSSTDGGYHLNKRIPVYGTTTKYIGKVDISYARSESFPEGRYFVTWEEKDSETSLTGHIYTSHNISGINSAFSSPVLLDNFLPGSDKKLCNPRIACQVSAVDNDSSNITEVILADKYDPVSKKFQVVGFYNNQAITSSNFRAFEIGDIDHNTGQSDICYNPYDSTFMVTYFDSTEKKIPYMVHNFNFTDPVEWTVLNSGINDNDSISSPWPKINLCYDKQQGAVVWTSENELGNGVAKYDAPFHYYTGTPDIIKNDLQVKSYPNPTSSIFNIDLELPSTQLITFSFYNSMGQNVFEQTCTMEGGKQHFTFNSAVLPAGLLFVEITGHDFRITTKVAVE